MEIINYLYDISKCNKDNNIEEEIDYFDYFHTKYESDAYLTYF